MDRISLGDSIPQEPAVILPRRQQLGQRSGQQLKLQPNENVTHTVSRIVVNRSAPSFKPANINVSSGFTTTNGDTTHNAAHTDTYISNAVASRTASRTVISESLSDLINSNPNSVMLNTVMLRDAEFLNNTLLSKAIVSVTKENEAYVWKLFISTRCLRLRLKLFEYYEAEVKKATGARIRKLPYRPLVGNDDIFNDGAFGLLKAIDSFDPKRGVPFEKWAGKRIRGAIIDGLRVLQSVPRSIAKARRVVRSRMQELYHILGSDPTVDQFCEHYGEEYRAILSNPLFSAEVFNQNQSSASEVGMVFESKYLSVESDVEACNLKLDRIHLAEVCEEVLTNFPVEGEKMANIIFGYFFFSSNLSKIAINLGTSLSSVTKLMDIALAVLREHPGLRENFHK